MRLAAVQQLVVLVFVLFPRLLQKHELRVIAVTSTNMV